MFMRDLTRDGIDNPAHEALRLLEKHPFLRLLDKPQYLWHCNYYDGPLNGVCLHNGASHWFEVVDEVRFLDSTGEKWWSRVYAVCPIPPVELRRLYWSHWIWDLWAGSYDYDESNRRVQSKHLGHRILCKIVRSQDVRYKVVNWVRRVMKAMGESPSYCFPNQPVVAWYKGSDWTFDQVLFGEEEGDDDV